MESINQVKSRADEIRRKSKKLLAFTIMTVAASALATTVRAQTFAEWFQQKKTQKNFFFIKLGLVIYTIDLLHRTSVASVFVALNI